MRIYIFQPLLYMSLMPCIAKYLTYADKILVVNSKTVIDGGSYHKALGQGLIDGLELRSTTHSSTNSELQHANVKEKSSEVTKARQKDDLKRAAGDFAVYKYYFQRVGWAKTLIFVSFVILNVGSYSFGRTSSINSTWLH